MRAALEARGLSESVMAMMDDFAGMDVSRDDANLCVEHCKKPDSRAATLLVCRSRSRRSRPCPTCCPKSGLPKPHSHRRAAAHTAFAAVVLPGLAVRPDRRGRLTH